MTSRLEQLVERFADGRNTRLQTTRTNEARIRSYLTGAVQPKYDFLEAVSEKLGVSIDWLISGEGRMLRAENRAEREAKKKAQRELEQEGLPVFDCDFTCGFDDVENDQTARPSYFMDTTFNRQADLWCSVQGRSMLPDLEPGDKIALRRVTIDNLEPGHILRRGARRSPHREDPPPRAGRSHHARLRGQQPRIRHGALPHQPHFAPL